jgi:hypothetical protein
MFCFFDLTPSVSVLNYPIQGSLPKLKPNIEEEYLEPLIQRSPLYICIYLTTYVLNSDLRKIGLRVGHSIK